MTREGPEPIQGPGSKRRTGDTRRLLSDLCNLLAEPRGDYERAPLARVAPALALAM